MIPKTALLLGAGYGNRLKPLTDALPKPLMWVGHLPLLFHHLLYLEKYKFEHVLVNGHYKAPLMESMVEYYKEKFPSSMKITFVHEPELLGTGGALWHLTRLSPRPESFLIVNSDILHDVPLDKFYRSYVDSGGEATLALKLADNEAHAKVCVDSQHRVRQIGPVIFGEHSELPRFGYCGIQMISGGILDHVAQKSCHLFLDVYKNWYEARGEISLNMYLHQGYWRDMGSLEEFGQMQADYLTKSCPFFSYHNFIESFAKLSNHS